MDNGEKLSNVNDGLLDDQEHIAEESRKYMTFRADQVQFAIDSEYVIEILSEYHITHLPKVPEFIKGIINLRGQIIPIIDISLRLNHPEKEPGRKACVIVVQIGENVIGLFVEEVLQMIDVPDSQIMNPPLNHRQEYVNGITRLEGEVYLMLDCESLIFGDSSKGV